MKNIVLCIALLLTSTSVLAGGTIKEVCRDKKDKAGNVIKGKDDKPMQVCKKIRVHKKLQGKKIPVKK